MNKSVLTFAVSALFCLTSVSAMAASHVGAAPMAGASAAAPMAAPAGGMFAGTKADAKALEKKADADYKVAKETCKPMKGDEKKICMKQAKATQEKAEAQAKGIYEMAEAKNDNERAKVTAKYEKKMADAEKKAMK